MTPTTPHDGAAGEQRYSRSHLHKGLGVDCQICGGPHYPSGATMSWNSKENHWEAAGLKPAPDPSGAPTSEAESLPLPPMGGLFAPTTPVSSPVAAETGTPSDYFCQWCYDKGLRMPGGDGPWIHSGDCPHSPEQARMMDETSKLRAELAEFYRADATRTQCEFALRDELKAAASVILLARKALIANGNTREGSEALNRGSIAVSKFITNHPELYGN